MGTLGDGVGLRGGDNLRNCSGRPFDAAAAKTVARGAEMNAATAAHLTPSFVAQAIN
jgi:hypothetical protein